MIRFCASCGWRGVPTLLGKRGRLRGVNLGMRVWESRDSVECPKCPACKAGLAA